MQPYIIYIAILYCMVAALTINIGLCCWVAWFFKEQKFEYLWPIQVLRLFSSVFFQAFDVSALNLLQVHGRNVCRSAHTYEHVTGGA